jgi:hypothetical protein
MTSKSVATECGALCGSVSMEWRGGRFVATRLFWFESEAESGFADAEFGALAEHGGADALLFEKCAVGGVEVAEVDVVFANFDDAVMAGYFGIGKDDVCAVAADDDARLFQGVSGACARAGNDGEDYGFRSREMRGEILEDQGGLRAGAVAACEGGQRRDHYGGVRMAARVDDGGRGAPGAAELYFGMRADVRILEHVWRAAVTACCLHGSKVAWAEGSGWQEATGLLRWLSWGGWGRAMCFGLARAGGAVTLC